MLYTQDLSMIEPKMRGEYFKIINSISKDLNKKWSKRNYTKETFSFETFSEAYDFAGQLLTGVAMKLRTANTPKDEDKPNKFLKGKYVLKMSTTIERGDKYVVHFKYN